MGHKCDLAVFQPEDWEDRLGIEWDILSTIWDVGLCENVVKIPEISDYNNNHVPIISWPWGYTPVTHRNGRRACWRWQLWQRKIHPSEFEWRSFLYRGKPPFRKGISHGCHAVNSYHDYFGKSTAALESCGCHAITFKQRKTLWASLGIQQFANWKPWPIYRWFALQKWW